MSDEKKGKISSVNPSVLEELSLVPLDERVELSPVGILDVLVANVDLLDGTGDAANGNCTSDNNCGAQGNCPVRNTCGSDGNCATQGNCGAQGKCGSKGSGFEDE